MHLKVFLACALGGGIGALVALQISQPFWWIGLIVGGLVGYLSYEFKAVLRAIPKAWTMARSDFPRWRSAANATIISFSVCSTAVFPVLLTAVILWFTSGYTATVRLLLVMAVLWMLGPLVFFFCEFSFYNRLHPTTGGVQVMRKINIFRIYGYYLPHGMRWVVRRTPQALTVIGVTVAKFVKYLFILIHSELRLLCVFDAAFGAAIGYFLGSAAIGALAGGLIGVLNFEIVSKRFLRLIPSR